jgi:YgiT-type zinc finger domain-containing protein
MSEMRKRNQIVSFWEGETCGYCGGDIIEERVTLHRKVKGKHVLIEDVPAGVCMECGTRYYATNVPKIISAHETRERHEN